MADSKDIKPFLVEIGTEELPPKSLGKLARAFLEQFGTLTLAQALQDARSTRKNEVFFSPRRLAIYAPAVRMLQPDHAEERLGPAISVAFDSDGRPTQAAEGFAKSCGVTVSQLKHRATDKGERLAHTVKIKGKNAAELLPRIVSEALAKLPIPKRMRWGTGEAQFVRPVHWAVMLLGEKPLKAEILGIKAGNKTHGHRFLHPAAITLKHPNDYRKALANIGKVLVEDRAGMLAKKIAAQVMQAAKKVHGRAQLDQALLEEVTALVEWPVPITGGFEEKFLALPDEVIVAVLQTQQRYFPIRDKKDGLLLPRFIAISNIQSKQPAEVRRGNERVIVPRLTDAMFFWDGDRKTRLEARSAELDRVVFQKTMGSYGDKSRRVAKLAAQIAEAIGGHAQFAQRAAQLCKCDLVTGMVGEFPELQGVMGAHYARHDGEAEEIAQAISEHYRPRYAGDALPVSQTGQALAIADKLDTLAGIFAAGQKPTGDKDPYGLRRAGLGLMRIMVERELDLDVAQFVRAALQLQPAPPREPQTLIREIYDFLMDRLRAYFLEVGIRTDVYDAVRACNPGKPLEFQRRIQALNTFLALPEAASLAAANKRIGNILRQAGHVQSPEMQAGLLREPAELALHAQLAKLGENARDLAHQGDYGNALKQLAALRAPVDSFFDRVLVMDPDPELRNNRLALLQQIRDAFLRIADISLLQVE